MKALKSVIPIFILLLVTASASAQGSRHCVTELIPGGGSIERGCFETLVESIEVASNGAIKLAPSATFAEIDQQLNNQTNGIQRSQPFFGGGVARTSYVIAIAYDYMNQGGDSRILTSTLSTGCQGTGYTWTMEAGWDNRVESAVGYINCNNFKMYENANATGAQVTCVSPCASFGLLNNQGSRMDIYS